MFPPLTRILFETEPAALAAAGKAGLRDFIVDWECKGKEARQTGYDTEINRKSLDDLHRATALSHATIWCRINGPPHTDWQELEMAIAGGADIIFLPMVTAPAEVETFLTQIAGRCRAGILVETPQACQTARELAQFPLDAIYVGLNDLMIGLGTRSIFSALASGLIDEVRRHFTVPLFGFGGLTVLDGGHPLPCRMFLQEIARLDGNMTFLRRSYKRDIADRDARQESDNTMAYWDALQRRTPEMKAADHRAFLTQVKQIEAAL